MLSRLKGAEEFPESKMGKGKGKRQNGKKDSQDTIISISSSFPLNFCAGTSKALVQGCVYGVYSAFFGDLDTKN